MSDQNTDSGDARLPASRRQFLGAVGAGGLLAGVSQFAFGRQETSYEFGGAVAGWEGRSPDAIAGETNPTLEVQSGVEYTVTWENVDGQPHNFIIRDDDGEEVVGTDLYSDEGETVSLTFEATEEMVEYICTVHPSSMVGDIEVDTGTQATPTDGTATPTAAPERFVPEGPSVGVEQVADGPLVNPVTLRSVPGEAGARVVVDQPGQVYVVDEELDEDPFLDVGDRVLSDPEERGGFDERGLLGLAFHPEFEDNGQFYVRYSASESADDSLAGPDDREFPEEFDHVEVLSEFETGDDSLAGDPDSERVLLEVPSPQFNHNGGEVLFGPDRYLYTTVGDGGDANDTGLGHVEDWYDGNEGGNAQNVEANLLGSVLRVDVDDETSDAQENDEQSLGYAVPEDNPFVDTGGYDEIYAYGLRNPWRMSFDGDTLVAADVGQNLFEEVDVIENGGNYGWNVTEGFHCFDAANPTTVPDDCPDTEPDEAPYDGSDLLDPVLEYPHQYEGQAVGISITGGYVYNGDTIDELSGQYVFGDWSASFVEPQGRLFAATPESAVATDEEDGTPDEETATATPTATPEDTDDPDGETPGDETPDGDGESDVDLTAPDEQPWQWEELVVEGADNGRLNRYVQAFGRDADGEVYVLASRTGRLEGDDGEVFRLVPAGEGETVEVPAVETPEGGEDGEPDEETETPSDDTQTATPEDTDGA